MKIIEILGVSLLIGSALTVATGGSTPMGADPNASAWLLNGGYAITAGAWIGYCLVLYCNSGFGGRDKPSVRAARGATALVAGCCATALALG